MLGELSGIVIPSLRQRIEKSIIGKLIKAKVNFGLGHPVKLFFKFTNDLAEELHKPVSKKYDRRRVNVNSIY